MTALDTSRRWLAWLAALVLALPLGLQGQESALLGVELVGFDGGLGAASGDMPSGVVVPPRFLEDQLGFPRVREAWERRGDRVERMLEETGVEDVGGVFFRVFKREHELEVWAREPGEVEYALVRTYPVCAVSGRLGPKREQGDQQVPEGFYEIDVFNPWSRYHLSLRVNYPNAVDRVRSSRANPGGDIYVHGGCATIGCVPVTDGYIEELYLLAASARDAGQRTIPIHIFPTRLDSRGMAWLEDGYGRDHADYAFWRNLRDGYEFFERFRTLPVVGHHRDRYTFHPRPETLVPVLSTIPTFELGVAPRL